MDGSASRGALKRQSSAKSQLSIMERAVVISWRRPVLGSMVSQSMVGEEGLEGMDRWFSLFFLGLGWGEGCTLGGLTGLCWE